MNILYKVVIGMVGTKFIVDPDLAGIVPLCVCREGQEHEISYGPGANSVARNAKYFSGTGKFTFRDAFAGDLSGDRSLQEKVYIRYKTTA